jgi:hypothetical protein
MFSFKFEGLIKKNKKKKKKKKKGGLEMHVILASIQ